MPTFGENLRKQREQRGLTLDAISTITKISPRMLRAIEEEHLSSFPVAYSTRVLFALTPAWSVWMKTKPCQTISRRCARARFNPKPSPNFRNSTTETAEEDEADRHRVNPNAGVTHLRNRDHATIARVDRVTNNRSIDPPPDRRLHQDDRRREPRRSDDREARPQNRIGLDPSSHDPNS